jgi:riboflavin kinase/FMN adenylyltransferase
VASVVLTFEPHPLAVLTPAAVPATLTSFDQKAKILTAMGLSVLGKLKFDAALSDYRALEFLDKAVATRLMAKNVFVGQDFHFGRGAEGTLATIVEWGQRQNPKVFANAISEVKGPKGETYSSSHVRGLIKEGLVAEAANILGRAYSIVGTVVAGQARGRSLGYPTANLGPTPQLTPGPGVYAVFAHLDGRTLPGMTSVGHNPTFISPTLTVETHVFDFNEDFYGANLELEFIARLRGVIRFDSAASLIRQLGEDAKMARAILAQRLNNLNLLDC